jgi:hypothetical protein
LVLHLRTSLAETLSLHGSHLRLWLTDSLWRDRICSQNHLGAGRNGSQDDKRYWSKGFHGSLLGKGIDTCFHVHIGLDAGHCENTIDERLPLDGASDNSAKNRHMHKRQPKLIGLASHETPAARSAVRNRIGNRRSDRGICHPYHRPRHHRSD